jgi:hypothetical protein
MPRRPPRARASRPARASQGARAPSDSEGRTRPGARTSRARLRRGHRAIPSGTRSPSPSRRARTRGTRCGRFETSHGHARSPRYCGEACPRTHEPRRSSPRLVAQDRRPSVRRGQAKRLTPSCLPLLAAQPRDPWWIPRRESQRRSLRRLMPAGRRTPLVAHAGNRIPARAQGERPDRGRAALRQRGPASGPAASP